MVRLRSWRLKRLPLYLILLGSIFFVLHLTLAYDNSVRLFFRWHTTSVLTHLRPPNHHSFSNTTTWYPVEMENIAMIIKTGWATRHKLAARLASYDEARNKESVVIVADYKSQGARPDGNKGPRIPVYDVLERLLKDVVAPEAQPHPRLEQYRKLRNAIQKGLKKVPGGVKGWELDIMKHMPALELGYELMPGRHWYVLADDDTLILPESLLAILEAFDPFVPHYLGNAAGTYHVRFAQRGSAIVLSQMAMQKLFIEHPDVVNSAIESGITADSGDKVISQALMKIGIYVEEGWALHFNADPPRKTKIRPDRFCEVVATFHQFASNEMEEASKIFGALEDPIAWIDVWSLLTPEIVSDGPDLQFPKMRTGWDYVGMIDDSVVAKKNVKNAGLCHDMCLELGQKCLAWVWKADLCHLAPWLIVGQELKDASSGVNVDIANKLALCE